MPETRTIAISRSQAIRTRLILAFLFITILPLFVVGLISVTGTLAQRDQIFSQLAIVTNAKQAQTALLGGIFASQSGADDHRTHRE